MIANPEKGRRGVSGVLGVDGTSAASFGSSPLPISKFSKSSTPVSGSCFRDRGFEVAAIFVEAHDDVVIVVVMVIGSDREQLTRGVAAAADMPKEDGAFKEAPKISELLF